MEIRYAPASLRGLDAAHGEAVVVPVTEDDRPLRGLAALLDWRLCGAVSQLVVQGRFSGRAGETLLVPPRPKFAFGKILFIGMGPVAEIGEPEVARYFEHGFSCLQNVRVRSSIWGVPHRMGAGVSPQTVFQLFLDAARQVLDHDVVTIAESDELRRFYAPVLDSERRRAKV